MGAPFSAKLGHECVAASGRRRVVCALGRDREVEARGSARHVRMAGFVEVDLCRSSEVRRVEQADAGIDRQRACTVRTRPARSPSASRRPGSGWRPPAPPGTTAAPYRAERAGLRRADCKPNFAGEPDRIGTGPGEADVARVGSGPHQELVLQPASLTAQDHVDARPEVAIAEPRVRGQVGVALRAGEVVHPALAGTPLSDDLVTRVRAPGKLSSSATPCARGGSPAPPCHA